MSSVIDDPRGFMRMQSGGSGGAVPLPPAPGIATPNLPSTNPKYWGLAPGHPIPPLHANPLFPNLHIGPVNNVELQRLPCGFNVTLEFNTRLAFGDANALDAWFRGRFVQWLAGHPNPFL